MHNPPAKQPARTRYYDPAADDLPDNVWEVTEPKPKVYASTRPSRHPIYDPATDTKETSND